jgi:hypothetical protein
VEASHFSSYWSSCHWLRFFLWAVHSRVDSPYSYYGTTSFASTYVNSVWQHSWSCSERTHSISLEWRPRATFFECFWCHRRSYQPVTVVRRHSLATLSFQHFGWRTRCKNFG